MKRIVMIVGLLVLAAVALQAQSTITANPQAVNMASRQLWRMEGRSTGDDRYGEGIGGGLDVNEDGYDDFFVAFGPQEDIPAQWKLFYGGDPPDTIADWQVDGVPSTPYPIVGEFFGDGRKVVGFGTVRVDTSNPGTMHWQRLQLFNVASGRMVDSPFAVAGEWGCLGGMQVVEADGETGDELVVVEACTSLQVWFYRGGPGFTVAEPTMILTDTERVVSNFEYASLGDIDGDGYVDMVTAAGYLAGWKLKFYWGNATSPWSWQAPDREILFGPENPPIVAHLRPQLLDVDGDGIQDIAFEGGYIYRSGSMKLPTERRNRSYTVADADERIVVGGSNVPLGGGYVNDRGRRYESLLMVTGGSTSYWFSGGANGIDTTYEAWYTDGWAGGPIFGERWSADVLDVNGDGWPDIGGCNWTYNNVGGTGNNGVAVVFAGGPEIPAPDSVAGIRTVTVGHHEDAVWLWPNPVRDELNIAWRGDLDRMPERFIVTDLVGRRVAWGDVEPWRGAAVWHTESVSAGV